MKQPQPPQIPLPPHKQAGNKQPSSTAFYYTCGKTGSWEREGLQNVATGLY